MIRQQLRDATDVALVNQAAASGARMTLALGVLVAEVMAAARRVGLKPFAVLRKRLDAARLVFNLGMINS
jgi:hypothetical protein